MLGVGRSTTGCLQVKISGNMGKSTFPHILPDGAIIIRNILTRRYFIPLNGLSGQIELLSFTTVPYVYYVYYVYLFLIISFGINTIV